MKKIRFVSQSDRAKLIEEPPKPSKSMAPEWYKKTKKFHSHMDSTHSVMEWVKKSRTVDPLHATYKLCIPFIDALTTGYIVTLPATVMVHQEADENGKMVPTLSWKGEWNLVDNPDKLTITNMPTPYGHDPMFFRWLNNWKIETPRGYSSLFMHPANRFDLPFTTLTGVVDTDKHINPVIFPFFIREGFEGEIPMGTPIAQILPFKREDWNSEKDHEENLFGSDIMKQTYIRYYKKMIWSKKNYS